MSKKKTDQKAMRPGQQLCEKSNLYNELFLRLINNEEDLGFVYRPGVGWMCGNCTFTTMRVTQAEHDSYLEKYFCTRCLKPFDQLSQPDSEGWP